MQSFPVSTGPSPGPRNYVFVDEHNRHKRLKVMRACEGCRRRKIRCDAATTNTWPCAACRRLKLPCVPPTGGVEGEGNGDQPEGAPAQDFQPGPNQPFSDQFEGFPRYQHQRSQSLSIPAGNYDSGAPQQTLYSPQEYGYPSVDTQGQAQPRPSLHDFRYHSLDHSASQPAPISPKTPEQAPTDLLTDHLGDLKISEIGVAPLMRNQKAANNEPPAPIQEKEIILPSLDGIAGGQICIPPTMMPSDEVAADYFNVFFEHIHPYVPVLCRSQFYNQWHHSRDSISPLLLEAIFACAARLKGEPTGDTEWLALANRHEAAFQDRPRLSTVQALLLLLKAREGSPKRGYYYKSWMTCKTVVSMAKDLDLHEHLSDHDEPDKSCGSGMAECLQKTRVWQTIAACELIIGAPQGRNDMGVDMETVDYRVDPPGSTIDEYETKISKQFAFFVRICHLIRLCLVAYTKVKKKKDWQMDPIFDRNKQDFINWRKELPEELQLPLVGEETPLKVPSHFVANMHAHHQLGMIMLYRPRILANSFSPNLPPAREHLATCYKAAKRLCRIQEAILKQHGFEGLLCMQRGMSYTIYATITCVMLHLVAITSPDPEFNVDARDYFTRHMRLLEKCAPEWPQADTMKQIENLRIAFSADLDQPFELKASFPYGSPGDTSANPHRSSEQSNYSNAESQPGFVQAHWQQMTQPHFPTPPMSINSDSTMQPNPAYFGEFGVNQQAQFRGMDAGGFSQGDMASTMHWNPAPIIDQFHNAFSIATAAMVAPPSTGTGYSGSPPLAVSVPPSISPHQYTQTSPAPTFDQNVYGQQQSGHPTQSPSMAMSNQSLQSVPSGHRQPSPGQLFGPSLQAQNGQHHMPPPGGQMTFPPEAQQQSVSNAAAIQPQPHNPGMVYVSPKEWQQSVAKVYDSSGLKRNYTFGIVTD